MIRELAVKRIKPLVPAGVWQTLRRIRSEEPAVAGHWRCSPVSPSSP